MAGAASMEEMQAKILAEKENEERRRLILDQILEPAASDRLTRLRYPIHTVYTSTHHVYCVVAW